MFSEDHIWGYHPVTDAPISGADGFELGAAMNRDRHVGHTKIVWGDGIRSARISTVHLGADHNFERGYPGADPRPVVWETMIFFDQDLKPEGWKWDDDYQVRYRSEEDAVAGHEMAVNLVTDMLTDLGVKFGRDDGPTPLLDERAEYRAQRDQFTKSLETTE